MNDIGASKAAPWRTTVIADFAASELFDRTFQEGMELVEETAAYLDGAGRQESKLLSRGAALSYAAESMRLTTRLMQLASWLLVQRSVREGNITAIDACDDRYRLKVPSDSFEPNPELPPAIVQLLERAERLYDRVLHLDRRMYVETPPDQESHPVFEQMDRIQAAFGGRRR